MSKYIYTLIALVFTIAAIYLTAVYLNNINSFEVVIARYNENLDWAEKEFPNEKITIYNKGEDDIKALPNWNVIKLPNIGRESHTYLYHIINNYNNLADRTLFLQGYPYDHLADAYLPLIKYKTKAFNHISNKCKNIIARCGDSITAYIKSYYKSDKFRLDALSSYMQEVGPHLRDVRKVIFKQNVQYDNLSSFISEVLGRKLSSDTVIGWSFGAQFAVDKEIILQHDIQYYNHILKFLDNPNPIEGYFLKNHGILYLITENIRTFNND